MLVDSETVPEAQTGGQLSDADAQLARRIKAALRSTGYAAVHTIDVGVQQGHVRLVGSVPTYFLKQVAQAKVLGVDGIKSLQNNLIVCAQATDAGDCAAT